ncbi:hypothetical protein LQ948_13965 [Jiella sp. MQZ9-1]|uniref:Uncharacterized protein n=1 Tax=Jiella flava TaxID=2816857 RepID=A0A939JV21_9HYPH|nr:hypothetical protein [Jiella flava]MBO0663740.1 hypothetical protein [Jiella flava]MCD2472312.1 hypothetical protein [Jiella flava]
MILLNFFGFDIGFNGRPQLGCKCQIQSTRWARAREIRSVPAGFQTLRGNQMPLNALLSLNERLCGPFVQRKVDDEMNPASFWWGGQVIEA